MALIRPQTRTQRPTGLASLLLSNPLTQALCFAAVSDSAQGFDLISTTAAALPSADSYVPTPMGLSWKFTGNSTNSGLDFGTFNPISTSDGTGTGDFTILAFCNPVSAAALNVLFSQRSGAGSLESIQLIANSTKAGVLSAGGLAMVTVGTLGAVSGARGAAAGVDGLPHVWAGRRVGTAQSVWKDGIDTTSASDASAPQVWSTAQKLEIGAQASYAGADMGANCSIVLCLAWNRALSNYEMGQIGRNPWQIFKANQPRLFGAGPAASGSVLVRYYYDMIQAA